MMRSSRFAWRRGSVDRRSPVLGLLVLALVGLALAAADWGHLVVSWSHIRTALGESLIVAAGVGTDGRLLL